jgi:hypothetical protein
MTNELQPINIFSSVVSNSSRFNFHNVYRLEDGTTFLQTWKSPEVPLRITDTTMVIPLSLSYRPDLISDKVYNTPLLSWAICYVNNILNPLDRQTGLYPGRLIRIPDPSTLYGMNT